MKKPLALLTAALAFGATTAPAAITNIDLDGSILNGFTIDRGGDPWVYTQANLIGFDVTAFAGASAAVVLVGNNASVPSAGNRATLLDGDFDLSTGLINMAVGNASVTLGLSAPLTNWTGPDFIFTDFDSDAADSVQILINGTTQTYSVTGTNLMTSLATDVYSSTSGTPGTLAALEASGYSKTSDTTQNVRALEIDLDDFGVPFGGSITQIQFGSSGVTVDPVFIGLLSVPEPSRAALMIAGLALVAARRRRD